MRVLHLDSGREMRGGQWQVLRLHRGLIARGHDSVLLAREGAPLLESARREALPAEPLSRAALSGMSKGFDVVHAHDARTHTLAALLSRVPLVVSRRVAFPVKTSWASRWKYRQPALFLAVSHFVGEQLRQAGVDEKRIAVVYDGVPVPQHAAKGSAILIPETLDPKKGMAMAEQAAAIAGLPVQRSANLETDLPGARALVYLSESEGLGSGILLAMSCGVTVIASNVGGIPELIDDGVNGILTTNEPAAVAAAFHRIRPELGVAARATVARRFTEAQMVENTLRVYEGLSGRV
jgi:hypothetical protein